MRISMLLHKGIAHDSRVRREASALAAVGHDVTVVYLPSGAEPELSELPYRLQPATLRRGRRHLPHAARLSLEARRLALRAASQRPDVVHAHDAAMLLPGLFAARRSGALLVYDSHELATGVPYRGRSWAAVVAIAERLGVRRADAVLTVSDGIAAELKRRYGLGRAPTVIRNLPDLPPPETGRAPNLRLLLGVGKAPLILHQGAVATGRGYETLLGAMALLPEAHVLFLGVEGVHAERVRASADAYGVTARTHLLGPVPGEILLSYAAQADVGVSLLEDICDNHRLALPNKLFEYVAADLPVVVADLPEVAALVRERGIGWCADPSRPTSVAAALRSALAGRDDEGLRQRLDQARLDFCWEVEKHRLLAVYEDLGRG